MGAWSHSEREGLASRFLKDPRARNALLDAPSDSRKEGGELVHERHPDWLEWELELSDHVCDRMVERGLEEIGLRLMPEHSLVITYRGGKPWAAYFRLPHQGSRNAHESELVEPGLIVDYGPIGSPIGIEITAPAEVTLVQFNELLARLGQQPVAPREFAPLHTA